MTTKKRKPYDFCVFQGDGHNFNVIYKDADGNIIDITGYDARMVARADYDADQVAFDLTVGDGLTITGVEGKIAVLITGDQTKPLAAGFYVYDLELYPLTSEPKTLIFGKMEILPEVKKS